MPHLVCISLSSRFDDYVINSVHVVNGINNYFIIVKATTEVAHHVCYSDTRVALINSVSENSVHGPINIHGRTRSALIGWVTTSPVP